MSKLGATIEWQGVPMRAVTWTFWNSCHGLARTASPRTLSRFLHSIGTPNFVSWRKPFVLQVSGSYTRATEMVRLGMPISRLALHRIPISRHCGNKIRASVTWPASPRTLSQVLPSLARQIACRGVNRSSCHCDACCRLDMNVTMTLIELTLYCREVYSGTRKDCRDFGC